MGEDVGIESVYCKIRKEELSNSEYYTLNNGYEVVYDDSVLPENPQLSGKKILETQKKILLILLTYDIRSLFKSKEDDTFEQKVRRKVCLKDWDGYALSIFVRNFRLRKFDAEKYAAFNKRVGDVVLYCSYQPQYVKDKITFSYYSDQHFTFVEKSLANFKLYNDEFLKQKD